MNVTPVGKKKRPISLVLGAVLLTLLAFAPLYAHVMNDPFLITLLSRILIFSIAALSLNLILGYGGMVSFGHALFMGLGVYSAAILAFHGIDNGWLQLLTTLVVCSLVGLLTGSIALRTSGIAFIMITLAFAQMFYFLFVSLSQYGGDDGMTLAAGSRFNGLMLNDAYTLYFTALAIVCLCLYGSYRLVHSRFGVVIGASKINEQRMKALGFPTFRYRLAMYVISAALCGVAGLLYANLAQFASPSYMAWTTSGELIVMVMLGGIGTLIGPLFGSFAMILTEEWLKSITEHWMIIFGPLLVVVATCSRLGIVGILRSIDQRRGVKQPTVQVLKTRGEP